MSDACDLLCLDLPAAERVRASMPAPESIAALAAAAQACSDPTRLALLWALDAQELCVCDLTWVVSRPQNLVSHHLRRLRDAGMVTTRREAKVVFYDLTGGARRMLRAFATLEVPA